jgi:hypothetical protein
MPLMTRALGTLLLEALVVGMVFAGLGILAVLTPVVMVLFPLLCLILAIPALIIVGLAHIVWRACK